MRVNAPRCARIAALTAVAALAACAPRAAAEEELRKHVPEVAYIEAVP